MHYRKVNGQCTSLHGFGVASALFFGVPKRMISVTAELIGSQIFILTRVGSTNTNNTNRLIPRSAIRTTLPTSVRVSPLSMFPASRRTV